MSVKFATLLYDYTSSLFSEKAADELSNYVSGLESENTRLREALCKIDGYVEAYINGVEIGETGDKQCVYPSDEETYTGIADIVSSVLKPEVGE